MSTPQLRVNGEPANPSTSSSYFGSSSSVSPSADGSGWGANFWVTLVDPQVCPQTVAEHAVSDADVIFQTGVSFFACPATGEVSWDPPVGNFL